MIHSSDEKARKGQVPGADIVDMETVSVARAAAQRDIPCAAVRVIFDDVSENLLPLDRFCDLDGRTLIGPTLLYLVSHPWHIPRLLDYGTRAKAAARLLGEFAAEFLSDESR